MVERQQRHIGIAIITFMVVMLVIVMGIQLNNLFLHQSLTKRIEDFERQRASLHLRERYQYLGAKNGLNAHELHVNDRLMNGRLCDQTNKWHNATFMSNATGMNFDAAIDAAENRLFEGIRESPLFKLLQTMPKGAALYAKDFAMCSDECLLKLTYYNDPLWICVRTNRYGATSRHINRFELFRFSIERPHTMANDLDNDNPNENGCKWILLSELRRRENSSMIDLKLRKHLTYHSGEHSYGIENYERLIHGLLTYEPIWSIYMQKSLEQFKTDNVQYIEIFSALPELYNLESGYFTYLDTARLMQESIDYFCQRNEEFIGAMLVYETSNEANDTDYTKFLERALILKGAFPDFFTGINLASNNLAASPLHTQARKLFALQNEFDYFYHINGARRNRYFVNDENLIDSVLFGSQRIAYEAALHRHPELLHQLRRLNVGIEISPTTIVKGSSYRVSGLFNHPSNYIFAINYPVVITSEYPGFWNTTPLTHEFYLTFVGLATKSANLGTLKQLAWNSLKLSSSRFPRKQTLVLTWARMWDAWISDVQNLDSTRNFLQQNEEPNLR